MGCINDLGISSPYNELLYLVSCISVFRVRILLQFLSAPKYLHNFSVFAFEKSCVHFRLLSLMLEGYVRPQEKGSFLLVKRTKIWHNLFAGNL